MFGEIFSLKQVKALRGGGVIGFGPSAEQGLGNRSRSELVMKTACLDEVAGQNGDCLAALPTMCLSCSWVQRLQSLSSP
jgi:hypothetical protein